jgi:hypothetical protein
MLLRDEFALAVARASPERERRARLSAQSRELVSDEL